MSSFFASIPTPRRPDRRAGGALVGLFLLGSLGAPIGLAFDDDEPLRRPSVWVSRDGDAAHVDADVWVRAAPGVARSVVIDFEGYPEFVPGADSCRVVEGGPPWRVDHAWTVRFIFSRHYRAEIEYTDGTAGDLTFRQRAGDLLGFRGTWSFVPDAGGTRIEYRSRLEYGFGAPWFLARGAATRHLRNMMTGLGREVLRRSDP